MRLFPVAEPEIEEMQMKIGILTYTREYANLGTNMQSYCTLKAVQAAYPSARVELVDYLAAPPSRRPYCSGVSLRSVRNDCIRQLKYNRFFKNELTFSNDRLVTRSVSRALEFIKRQGYDAIYVGSDTVLELKGAKNDRLTPYWLDSTIPGTKFLAAASAHSLTVESLSGRQRYLIERAVDGFALLGVRDDATFRLLAGFARPADRRLEIVPDPTFTYDIDYSHVAQYLAARNLHLPERLVCFHLLRDSTWARALADGFRRKGYVVASLRPARYADILFTDLSPFEQMGLYRYFSLVITHRFHDTIFCLKNLTPVIAFPEFGGDVTSQGESKLGTLMKAFGLESPNYIQNREMLTAEYLLANQDAAIAHFSERRTGIQARLVEESRRYKEFIQRSRAVIQ